MRTVCPASPQNLMRSFGIINIAPDRWGRHINFFLIFGEAFLMSTATYVLWRNMKKKTFQLKKVPYLELCINTITFFQVEENKD